MKKVTLKKYIHNLDLMKIEVNYLTSEILLITKEMSCMVILIIAYFWAKAFLQAISHFCKTTDTPILDFR